MTPQELEEMHRLYNRHKVIQGELESIAMILGVPAVSSRPLACYVQDLKDRLGHAEDTIKQFRETLAYLEQERESQP